MLERLRDKREGTAAPRPRTPPPPVDIGAPGEHEEENSTASSSEGLSPLVYVGPPGERPGPLLIPEERPGTPLTESWHEGDWARRAMNTGVYNHLSLAQQRLRCSAFLSTHDSERGPSSFEIWQ